MAFTDLRELVKFHEEQGRLATVTAVHPVPGGVQVTTSCTVVREGGDKGVPVVGSHPDSPQAQAFRKVSEEVARQVSIEAMKPELVVLGKGQ